MTLFTVQFYVKSPADRIASAVHADTPGPTLVVVDVFAESQEHAETVARGELARPDRWGIDSIVEN